MCGKRDKAHCGLDKPCRHVEIRIHNKADDDVKQSTWEAARNHAHIIERQQQRQIELGYR